MPDLPGLMNPRFRTFLAGSEVAGGIAVLVVPFALTFQGLAVAWWYWPLLLCFGGLAVGAGVWLWRDDVRGWKVSRMLQALQIVQFQTSSFGLGVLAGVQMPWYVSINFFSAYALYALLRSGPDRSRNDAARQGAVMSGAAGAPDTVAALFQPEPTSWGLRGDPYLWREMKERLASVPWPRTAEEVAATVAAEFERLTGHPISHPEMIYVERHSHGGMSSGMVWPEFWRDTAIPLLQRRYAEHPRPWR